MRYYPAPTQEQPTDRASQGLGHLVPQLRDLEGNREDQLGNSTRRKGLVFPLRSKHGIGYMDARFLAGGTYSSYRLLYEITSIIE